MATIIGTMYSGNPESIRSSTMRVTRHFVGPHHPRRAPRCTDDVAGDHNRIQEISFNTSLIREMRMIASYNKLIEQGRMGGSKRMLMHVIEAEEFIRAFSWSSRLNADWEFLQHLCNVGRARADQWLEANFDRLGIDFDC